VSALLGFFSSFPKITRIFREVCFSGIWVLVFFFPKGKLVMPSICEIMWATPCLHSQRLLSGCSVQRWWWWCFKDLFPNMCILQKILRLCLCKMCHPWILRQEVPSQCPERWSNMILDVSGRVFWMKLTCKSVDFGKADYPP